MTTARRDLRLNDAGDLDLSSGGLAFVDGLAALEQAVRIRLRFFKGEWFLDTDAGLPYFTDVMGKKPNPALLDGAFRRALLETPGVSSVEALTMSLDSATRRLTVDFRVTGDLGVLESSVTL